MLYLQKIRTLPPFCADFRTFSKNSRNFGSVSSKIIVWYGTRGHTGQGDIRDIRDKETGSLSCKQEEKGQIGHLACISRAIKNP